MHHFRRVADDDQVGLVIHEQGLGTEHRLQQLLRLLRLRVGQVQGLDDLVLVFLLLRGGIGIDQDHVLGEHLAGKLVLPEHEFHRLLDGNVADEDAGLAVAAHILVEDEIDAGLAGEHLENHLGVRVAELQRYGDLFAPAQLWSDTGRPEGHVDFRLQFRRRGESRILGQNLADLDLGRVQVPGIEFLLCASQHGRMLAVGLDGGHPPARWLVAGFDGEYSLIGRLGVLDAPLRARPVARGHEQLHDSRAARLQVQPEGQVVGLILGSLLEFLQAFLEAAVVDVDHAFTMQLPAGAAHE